MALRSTFRGGLNGLGTIVNTRFSNEHMVIYDCRVCENRRAGRSAPLSNSNIPAIIIPKHQTKTPRTEEEEEEEGGEGEGKLGHGPPPPRCPRIA